MTAMMTKTPMPMDIPSRTSVNKLKKAFDSADEELMEMPLVVEFVVDMFNDVSQYNEENEDVEAFKANKG
jgi:hypothetical protein